MIKIKQQQWFGFVSALTLVLALALVLVMMTVPLQAECISHQPEKIKKVGLFEGTQSYDEAGIQEETLDDRVANVSITMISELKRYTDSYIEGEVVRLLDEDEFRLRDSSGRIKVYTGWKNTNLVRTGEKVVVRGVLDRGWIKEFYATEIIRENGEVLRLTPDY